MKSTWQSKKPSQKTHSIFISISSTVQMTSLAARKSAFPQPKHFSASHLSSYLRKLLSCLHTQGSSRNLTLLRPRTCCRHGNGHDATGTDCGTAGHRQGRQPGSLRQCCWRTPPLAKLLKKTPTTQPATVKPSQTGHEKVSRLLKPSEQHQRHIRWETIGDHLTFILAAMQLLLCHYQCTCFFGSTEKSLITLG